MLRTHTAGSASAKNASPSGWSIDRSHAARRTLRSKSSARASACASVVVAVVLVAGTADHDLVPLDGAGHWPVPGPVLGIRGFVLDGGIEPQPVALLAVVERPLEPAHGVLVLGAPAATAAAALLGLVLV